jgi:NAD(P)-dependent dehydrogenase (short-subunit alcohol dehydrogenase family)
MTSGEPRAPGTLDGRVILVSGACGGFGSALARRIAALGATPVLLGRRVPLLGKLHDEIEAASGRQPGIYPLNLEGASPDDYAHVAEDIERECGRLDGIVHAAASFDGLTSLEQTGPEDWLKGLHVNLSAPLFLTLGCLPLLRRQSDAAVVFMLDDAELQGRAYWGAYGIAKAGLEKLVAMLGAELERSPVRVHGLRPGPMRTRLRARAWFSEDPGSVPDPDHYVAPCIGLLAGVDADEWRGRVMDLTAASAGKLSA